MGQLEIENGKGGQLILIYIYLRRQLSQHSLNNTKSICQVPSDFSSTQLPSVLCQRKEKERIVYWSECPSPHYKLGIAKKIKSPISQKIRCIYPTPFFPSSFCCPLLTCDSWKRGASMCVVGQSLHCVIINVKAGRELNWNWDRSSHLFLDWNCCIRQMGWGVGLEVLLVG